jgi:hypothetical protein
MKAAFERLLNTVNSTATACSLVAIQARDAQTLVVQRIAENVNHLVKYHNLLAGAHGTEGFLESGARFTGNAALADSIKQFSQVANPLAQSVITPTETDKMFNQMALQHQEENIRTAFSDVRAFLEKASFLQQTKSRESQN